ncbi:ABC transporter substrate-binding protein [Acidianus ambivalens]|uniref:Solute-binding protein family 5 domain-containing protein n=1 Tax=Acidianus ambivalens TaxID=2283 RepID=A0A650CWK1_ACIAM|nr:ABC transporter substrate-binding protein [Acidianus ambivalens]MQL54332.1 hypothetical protein [Acidianus ambivalens]QGR22158.1 hypothetical protein D1866_09330 [Acidianus ambivalens]
MLYKKSRLYASILVIIVMLGFYLPTINGFNVITHSALTDKITNGTWVWAPEAPPTPGGIYWNFWSPTNLVLGFFQYLPLAVYVHNDHQFIPILATNWTWNGNELIVTLRHPYYWDTVNGPKPFTAWDVWTTYMIGIRLFGWYSNYGLYNVTVINNYTVAFWFKGIYWKNLDRTAAIVLASYIGAPYFQFGKYAKILATLNTSNLALSSYLSNLTSYIESLNVTPTSNGFYFPNVSSINDELMCWVANPYFEQAFPNSSIKYYPKMITYWSSGNTQTYNFLEGGLLGYCVTAIPYSIYETIKSEGYIIYMACTYGGVGFYLNPQIYPFNNPIVRQALYYAINTTELAEAYAPDYISGPTNFAGIPSGFLPEFQKMIPSSFFQGLNNYSYNLQKATQLLEEAGLKKVNGYWVLPNGSQLTISIIVPSGFTDFVALSQEFATQLNAFGIKAQVYELSTSDFYSEFFSGDFEAAPFFTPFTDTIDAWRIASIIPQPPFNLSKPTWYIYNGENYTINVSQIVIQMHTLQYGSPQYINDTGKLMAWYNYWLPAIADVQKVEPVELNPYEANWNAILSTHNQTLISTILFPFIAYDFEYMGPVIGLLMGYIVPPGVTPHLPTYVKPTPPTTTVSPSVAPKSSILPIVGGILVVIIVVAVVFTIIRRRGKPE